MCACTRTHLWPGCFCPCTSHSKTQIRSLKKMLVRGECGSPGPQQGKKPALSLSLTHTHARAQTHTRTHARTQDHTRTPDQPRGTVRSRTDRRSEAERPAAAPGMDVEERTARFGPEGCPVCVNGGRRQSASKGGGGGRGGEERRGGERWDGEVCERGCFHDNKLR